MIKRKTWYYKNKLAIQVKIADELWTFSRTKNDNVVEKSNYIFHFGWYDKSDCPNIRMWDVTILWLSIQIAVGKNKSETKYFAEF